MAAMEFTRRVRAARLQRPRACFGSSHRAADCRAQQWSRSRSASAAVLVEQLHIELNNTRAAGSRQQSKKTDALPRRRPAFDPPPSSQGQAAFSLLAPELFVIFDALSF